MSKIGNREEKIDYDNLDKPEIIVETFYNIDADFPYVVRYKVGDYKEKEFTFATKFFATWKANRLAKVLQVEPDLDFEPI